MRAVTMSVLLIIVGGCKSREGEKVDQETRTGAEQEKSPDVKPVEREMVRIPAGEFLGAEKWCFDGSLKVRHPENKFITDHVRLTLPAYAIDATVVSCGEFQRCVAAGRCRAIDREKECSAGIATVDRAKATEFCAWRGMQLQSYDQWQRAARGVHGWTYPRGDTPDDSYKADQRTVGRGRRYVSPDGLVYFMVDVPPDVRAASTYLDREHTRDDDCVAEADRPEVHDRLAVVVGLEEQRLNRVRIQDPTWAAQFRCVDEVVSN